MQYNTSSTFLLHVILNMVNYVLLLATMLHTIASLTCFNMASLSPCDIPTALSESSS